MRRAVLLALVLAAALAAPAQAGIISAEDAAELAQTLAEAQEEQDVCYGWHVTNNFSTNDVGSSTGGPGVPLVATSLDLAGDLADPDLTNLQATCPKGAVILQGDIDYSCDSCEASDTASISIASNLKNPPTVEDLEGLGLNAGALTGDNDDTTLVNMINALPLLVADRGNAPYVEYEPAKTVPPTDHATNKPGSDLLRESWLQLVLFGGLILAGPGFFLYKRSQRKPAPRFVAPPPPPPPATPPGTSAEPPATTSAQPPATTSAEPPAQRSDERLPDPFTEVGGTATPEPDPPAEPNPPQKPQPPPPAT